MPDQTNVSVTSSQAPEQAPDKPIPGTLLRLRKYPASDGRPALVLCSSIGGYDLADCASDGGITLYSELVKITASKDFAGHVGLFANQVIGPVAPEKTETSTAVVSCNGKAGKEHALDDTAAGGEKGGEAWNLTVSVEECIPTSIDRIQFQSRGGNGGDGRDCHFDNGKPQEGAGSSGADGGSGGKIQVLLGGALGRVIALGRSIAHSSHELAEDEETARRMFEDHIASVANFIDYCRIVSDQVAIPDLGIQLRSLEVISTYGWIEYPVEQERILLRGILSALGSAVDDLCIRMSTSIDVSGGAGGVGGIGALQRASSGSAGQRGTYVVNYNYMNAAKLCQLSVPFAHPDQCAMVLAAAKFYYFQASLVDPPTRLEEGEMAKPPENAALEQCQIYLSRLQRRLQFLDKITPQDPLYQAYKEAEYTMRVLPRVGNDSDDVPSILALKGIKNEVETLLRQIATQVDFYGHPPGYVPRANHHFYQDLLTPLLENLKVAEEAHLLYFQENSRADERKTAIRKMNAQVEESIKEHKKGVTKLKNYMKSQITLAQLLHTKMKAAQEDLKAKMKEVSSELSNLSPWPGLSFLDFVEAATAICFCPNPAMIGVQCAGLLAKGYTNAGIRNAKGEYVDKTLLVEQIKTVDGDAASIMTAYQEIKSNGSKLNIDDPGAAKLIVKKEEVMELFKGFKNKLGEKSLKDLEAAFQHYIDISTERNTAILQYNAAFDSWLKSQESISYLESHRDGIESSVSESDSDLAAIALFMERSYMESLHYVLEIFYLAQKSIWFWSLKTNNYLGKKLANNIVSNITYSSLKDLQSSVIKELQSATESIGHEMQTFTGFPLHLGPSQVEELRQTSATVVRIPTNSTGMNGKGFPFLNTNGVRLTKARFFLPGATSSNNVIRVRLVHMGQETIVDHDGTEHDFQHERISILFQYRIDLAPNFPEKTDYTIDGDIGKETGSDYALVGPFTTWSISVESPDDQTEISLKNITGAYFSFHGFLYG